MFRFKSNQSEYGYFLRVYELKNKFRELKLKDSSQQKIIRQLSGCIQQKFDGFNIICVEYNKKLRKNFKTINLIYKPVRKPEKKIYVTVQQIFQKDIEALVAKEKKIKKKQSTGLPMSAITAESFLPDLRNIKGTWKSAQAYPVCI